MTRLPLLLLAAFVAILIAGLGPFDDLAASPTAAGHSNADRLALAGQHGGASAAVAVDGSYAYVGIGPRVVALDLSTPAQPRRLGATPPLPGIVRDIALSNGFAFVAGGDAGLRIVDIADPANPTVVGVYYAPGSVESVAVSDTYAFIAVQNAGLRVVNVLDPAHPIEVSAHDTPGAARGLALSGDFAFVADGDAGLRVISLADPGELAEIGSYDTPGHAWNVAIDNGHAYVADGDAGLRIINIANPANPTETGFYDTSGQARDVAIRDGRAYVADGVAGLRILNIANPASPSALGFYDTPGSSRGVALSGGYAVLADYDGGPRVVSISDATTPFEVGAYHTPGWAAGVTISGAHALIAAATGGLRVVSVADPAHPTDLGYFDTAGWSESLAVNGDYALVADGSAGLRILDISDPANPAEIGFHDTPGWARGVAVSGAYAFVADGWDGGLRVVNVADPANPGEAGFFDTPGWAQGVAVSGDYVFVADDGGGLRVLNAANPASPTPVGFYDTPGRALGVAVGGNYAYVADGDAGLRVIDVSNPADPSEIGFYDTPGLAVRVAVSGAHAFVGDEWAGLRVVDITNPARPVEVGVSDTPGAAYGLAVAGDTVFVADWDGGLFIFDYAKDNPTPTPTPTSQPDKPGDSFEEDDACQQASQTTSDGALQLHTFHDAADSDWVRFQAQAGVTYLVEAYVPTQSQADVILEVYSACAGVPQSSQNYSYSAGVRLEFEAIQDGPTFLHFFDSDPARAGSDVSYTVTVRALAQLPKRGALILVAGRLTTTDPLQANIHHVTETAYDIFLDQGYTDDDIFYLSTDLGGLPLTDAYASTSALRAAITQWAADRAGPDRALTLFMMDHGAQGRFYLDKRRSDWVTPEQIDQWLDQLETARPGVKVNVIIEACYSGSFLAPLSKEGRVIIASTDAINLAWASPQGAVFSDHFLAALGRIESLNNSFLQGQEAAALSRPSQRPWLDGNGNGLANEIADLEIASMRGFAYAGTFAEEQWPPFIAAAQVTGLSPTGSANIRAEVRDDVRVRRVWAEIYPPTYQPPADQEQLASEVLPTIVLNDQGNDQFAALYPGFSQPGLYRIVIYAEDDAQEARPYSLATYAGPATFLPMLVRTAGASRVQATSKTNGID